jgi:hypothetical protein
MHSQKHEWLEIAVIERAREQKPSPHKFPSLSEQFTFLSSDETENQYRVKSQGICES